MTAPVHVIPGLYDRAVLATCVQQFFLHYLCKLSDCQLSKSLIRVV